MNDSCVVHLFIVCAGVLVSSLRDLFSSSIQATSVASLTGLGFVTYPIWEALGFVFVP